MIIAMVGLLIILGWPGVSKAQEETHKVTICHATESETNPYVRIVVDRHAIGGHFDNQGNPLVGHEQDLLLEGEVDCPGGESQPTPTPTVTDDPEATPTPTVEPTETPAPTATPTPSTNDDNDEGGNDGDDSGGDSNSNAGDNNQNSDNGERQGEVLGISAYADTAGLSMMSLLVEGLGLFGLGLGGYIKVNGKNK